MALNTVVAATGSGRHVVVEIALLDGRTRAETPPRFLDHLGRDVHAAVAEASREEQLPEAAVAAGEIEDLVAGLERGAERADQIRPVLEVRRRVRVLPPGPVLCLARVLPFAQLGDLTGPCSQREQPLRVLAHEASHATQMPEGVPARGTAGR